MYFVRIETQGHSQDFLVKVRLDGASEYGVPTGDGFLTLEFGKGTTHKIELEPGIIQAEAGKRYVLSETTWEFSSGGIRVFTYKLQFYLSVISSYGATSGTGWYDANTTATASVYPLEVQGFVFNGWRGHITSTSPSVQVTMDSEKQIEAQWTQNVSTTTSVPPVVFLITSLTLGVMVSLAVFKSGRAGGIRGHQSVRYPRPE
jgi:uncharacterized repeat protein (TIGR02543 family)